MPEGVINGDYCFLFILWLNGVEHYVTIFKLQKLGLDFKFYQISFGSFLMQV